MSLHSARSASASWLDSPSCSGCSCPEMETRCRCLGSVLSSCGTVPWRCRNWSDMWARPWFSSERSNRSGLCQASLSILEAGPGFASRGATLDELSSWPLIAYLRLSTIACFGCWSRTFLGESESRLFSCCGCGCCHRRACLDCILLRTSDWSGVWVVLLLRPACLCKSQRDRGPWRLNW